MFLKFLFLPLFSLSAAFDLVQHRHSILDPCKINPCLLGQVCVPEPKQCIRAPCPQYRCDNVANPCSQGPCPAWMTCLNVPGTAAGYVCTIEMTTPPFDACNPNPCSTGTCIAEPQHCFTEPCPQHRCQQDSSSDACGVNPCGQDELCINEPKECFTQPCFQFHCQPFGGYQSPCDSNPCIHGQRCVEEPKQCIRAPCPQFRCEADTSYFTNTQPVPTTSETSTPRQETSADRHYLCCFWATQGECSNNPFWMKVNCQDSCGTQRCSIDNALGCKVTLNVEQCQDKYGQISTTPDYAVQSTTRNYGENCKDQHELCNFWAWEGLCETNSWMMNNCHRACRIC